MTADTKEPDTADQNTEAESSGKASYHGYEYQTLATVWLGLELFTTGIADAIDVEPPVSQEDVEVALVKSAEEIAELADSGVRLNKVEIQIKYRSAPAWKSRDFKALLASKLKKGKKGPAPRIRPIDFLVANPSFQYILLTNAQIDPSLKSFLLDE